jgi:hypothetical protein
MLVSFGGPCIEVGDDPTEFFGFPNGRPGFCCYGGAVEFETGIASASCKLERVKPRETY